MNPDPDSDPDSSTDFCDIPLETIPTILIFCSLPTIHNFCATSRNHLKYLNLDFYQKLILFQSSNLLRLAAESVKLSNYQFFQLIFPKMIEQHVWPMAIGNPSRTLFSLACEAHELHRTHGVRDGSEVIIRIILNYFQQNMRSSEDFLTDLPTCEDILRLSDDNFTEAFRFSMNPHIANRHQYYNRGYMIQSGIKIVKAENFQTAVKLIGLVAVIEITQDVEIRDDFISGLLIGLYKNDNYEVFVKMWQSSKELLVDFYKVVLRYLLMNEKQPFRYIKTVLDVISQVDYELCAQIVKALNIGNSGTEIILRKIAIENLKDACV